ncbi:UDP-N-acetylglucosamine 2-epimerase (non-hydrolyzing) [Candidatus Sulfidibacterium hydrothermale]|uniref:non-hydrolyzing UDP-N-acetylglucosamine 2-epimerase n=1 Tax=Candidatus Sulfidibacterium hydrothermale TaxID=2875962 RepID=UPI001F0A6910|nr:UDP-N-acetylglucosamine 2-epimerase (non-hydrolyzing) [Candidatus Sulfidibacterium hydrothermale]UBM62450.1 UDP-N-acetylglucosamine 2-epimerase (non-hydrolyzing) [Candidatus Sulfidibacterium hydrothermale]
MKVISVVGARPNFMKIAPFIKAIDEYNSNGNTKKIDHILVHTGQHYDDRMSNAFFEALNIPKADINLGVGSGTHAEQVGYTMIEFEKVLEKEKPDWVVVVGDVNATLACSVTAKKLNIKVCHIEAGLRSGDMTMPEEINRLVTDRLSDLLLIPDRISGENLKKEGIPDEKIAFVGNIMIDTLETNRSKAEELSINQILQENSLCPFNFKLLPLQSYALLTLHRPSNVDRKEILQPIINFLSNEVARDMYLIWPIHPRAQKRLKEFSLWEELGANEKVILLYPVGYHEMLKLNMEARIILTDSGGLQEESCVLGTPCLTLRWNTERPVTLRENGGASVLVGNNVERIRKEYQDTLKLSRHPQRPELWDGKTAERCVEAIVKYKG